MEARQKKGPQTTSKPNVLIVRKHILCFSLAVLLLLYCLCLCRSLRKRYKTLIYVFQFRFHFILFYYTASACSDKFLFARKASEIHCNAKRTIFYRRFRRVWKKTKKMHRVKCSYTSTKWTQLRSHGLFLFQKIWGSMVLKKKPVC